MKVSLPGFSYNLCTGVRKMARIVHTFWTCAVAVLKVLFICLPHRRKTSLGYVLVFVAEMLNVILESKSLESKS